MLPKNEAWPRPAAGSPLDSNVIKCAPAGLGTTPENAHLSCVKRPDLLTTCTIFPHDVRRKRFIVHERVVQRYFLTGIFPLTSNY